MRLFSEKFEDMQSAGVVGMEVILAWKDLPLPSNLIQIFDSNLIGKTEEGRGFNLFLISDTKPPFGLLCRCSGKIEKAKLSAFNLRLNRLPVDSPPPSDVLEQSNKLGGFPNGLNRLLKEFPDDPKLCEISLSAFITKGSKWAFKIQPRSIGQAVAPLKLVEEVFEFAATDSTTATIALAEDSIQIAATSNSELVLNDHCFDAACQSIWQKLTPLFEHNAETTPTK